MAGHLARGHGAARRFGAGRAEFPAAASVVVLKGRRQMAGQPSVRRIVRLSPGGSDAEV